MKGTLKIDYERSRENNAVIKIFIPNPPQLEGKEQDYEEDVRDKLLQDFIKHPLFSEPYNLFTRGTFGETPTGYITTIIPIENDKVLGFFHKWLIGNYCNSIGHDTQHINEFISWVRKLNQKDSSTCGMVPREVFEEIESHN